MRRFSFRPALTLRGRQFKGPRGWAGKPFHPPLTDVPIGAYLLTGGPAVSVLAAFTGLWDWLRSTEADTQARRTANAHAWTMLSVTTLVLVDIALRVFAFTDDQHTPVVVRVPSVLIALLTTVGAAIGGTLTFDYGFNVETAGGSPAWHRSEDDLLPGEERPDGAEPQPPPRKRLVR